MIVAPYLWILVKIAATSYVGLQRFWRMSKHNSPVPYTFGWNIWLTNFTPGGLFGYCSSKCITRRNVPSSKGVPSGPIMTAFLKRLQFGWGIFGLIQGYWPCHDIICYRRRRNARGRISLHALFHIKLISVPEWRKTATDSGSLQQMWWRMEKIGNLGSLP